MCQVWLQLVLGLLLTWLQPQVSKQTMCAEVCTNLPRLFRGLGWPSCTLHKTPSRPPTATGVLNFVMQQTWDSEPEEKKFPV